MIKDSLGVDNLLNSFHNKKLCLSIIKEALEELQIPPYKEEEVSRESGSSGVGGNLVTTAATSSNTTAAISPADSAASPASCSSKDSGVRLEVLGPNGCLLMCSN